MEQIKIEQNWQKYMFVKLSRYELISGRLFLHKHIVD
jgi:hypothetical protein